MRYHSGFMPLWAAATGAAYRNATARHRPAELVSEAMVLSQRDTSLFASAPARGRTQASVFMLIASGQTLYHDVHRCLQHLKEQLLPPSVGFSSASEA